MSVVISLLVAVGVACGVLNLNEGGLDGPPFGDPGNVNSTFFPLSGFGVGDSKRCSATGTFCEDEGGAATSSSSSDESSSFSSATSMSSSVSVMVIPLLMVLAYISMYW